MLGAMLFYFSITDFINGYARNFFHIHRDVSNLLLGLSFSFLLLGVIKFPPAYKIMSLYPLRFLGMISYSIFMWHSFIITANTSLRFSENGGLQGSPILGWEGGLATLLLLYFPAFIFFSSVSFLFIEKPFYKFRGQNQLINS